MRSLRIWTGPEKYGERGNGVPRKVAICQEVRAYLADLTRKPGVTEKIFRKDQVVGEKKIKVKY